MLVILLAFIVASAFSFAEPQDTFAAAKKCKKPTITYVKSANCREITLKYTLARKGEKPSVCFVYMKQAGGKYRLLAKTKKKTLTAKKLKAGTRYTFKVRTAKAYRQKQWYNKKTKKWQAKKPKKKYRGKTRKVLKYKWYSYYSKVKTVKTQDHAYSISTAQPNFTKAGSKRGACKWCNSKMATTHFGTAGCDQVLSAKATVMQTNGTAGAFLSWTAATGATGYIVERSVDDNAYTDVYYSKEPYYFDEDVLAGKKYTYRITAYANLLGSTTYGKNASTVELTGNSPFPESLQPNTKTNRAAAAPIISETTGLTATPSYMTVKLSWKAVTKAKKYEIFCNGESKGEATGTSYTVSDLTPKTAYSFTVVAKRDGLTGDASIVVGTKTTATPSPKNIKAVAGWDNVTLSWDPVEGADKYIVQNPTDLTWKNTNGATSYTISDLASNQKYTFRVDAYVKGCRSNSAQVTCKTGFQAPGNIHATKITDTSAVIVWDPVEGADRYRVYKGQGTSYVEVTSCSLKVASLTPDTTYTYYVVAGGDGQFGQRDDENKVTFTTLIEEEGFTPNTNIKLDYNGVNLYLGKTWNPTLYNNLKAASNGYDTASRPGYAYELKTYTEHDAVEYMFDTDDYTDFLAVIVADGKIIGWETNGPVFGTYYGQDVIWGDDLNDYLYGIVTGYRTRGSACTNIFTDIDRGDTVIGGFAFLTYPRDRLLSNEEKKIGYHYINAYRYAAGKSILAYSNGLDGLNDTWTGTFNGKTWTNTRFGAQAFAESFDVSDMPEEDLHGISTPLPAGPLKGQKAGDRNGIILKATGERVLCENVASGGIGESCLGAYMTSDGHMLNMLTSGAYLIGIGISGQSNAQIYGIPGN